MPNQAERAELHKTIWKIANDLRGSVDGWEFKAYVLGHIYRLRPSCQNNQVVLLYREHEMRLLESDFDKAVKALLDNMENKEGE